MYENQLPLAIESKSQRRLFFPEGGSTYGPTGGGANPNIIRIPINADSLLDVQHSYLQFVVKSTGGGALAPDIGVPFIRRLRIESAGTTLEDIDNYGKLYGGVLFPSQASAGALQEATLQTKGVGTAANSLSAIAATACPAVADNAEGMAGPTEAQIRAAINVTKELIRTAITDQNAAEIVKLDARTIDAATTIASAKHSLTSVAGGGIANDTSATYNVPLISALFNMEKYLPLVMMNAGLTIEIELGTAQEAGVARTGDDNAGVGQAGIDWEVSDVRYVAHLIDLQRDFYDRMRMVMEGSGGVLQLAGTTFRHYQGTTNAGAGTNIVNIPSRIKSIKSVFFTQTPTAEIAAVTEFSTSNSVPNGLTAYQYRVGSVVYPPTSVKAVVGAANLYSNKGEFYNELRKSWGNLGAYDGQGVLLNQNTYLAADNATCATATAAPATPQFNPFGLDFESFQKISAENGINTADRSLPMSLELTNNAQAVACIVDVWVMCDAIFYVNLDGSVSVSI